MYPCIDNQPETKEEARTGRYTSGLFGPPIGQLVSTISLRTKDSRDGQFIIVRFLADEEQTLVLTGTLRVTVGREHTPVRRV